MAERPIFVPNPLGSLVVEHVVTFEWNPGFALVQKRKNIEALHQAAREQHGIQRLLEISSKSPVSLGVRLSAFNLYVPFQGSDRPVPLEAAFQGSKVFAESGQQPAIYASRSGAEAKKRARQFEEEPLVAFQFEGRRWPLSPTTAFYDWLYLRALVALSRERVGLLGELSEFYGFTDIEFNPKRSVNCQARSSALFIALSAVHDVEALTSEPRRFVDVISESGYGQFLEPPGLF